MNYKKEIQKLLLSLKKEGHTRAMIEAKLNLSRNAISQALSRGGNEKLLTSIQLLADQLLQKATNNDNDGLITKVLDQQNKLLVSLEKQAETANRILKRLSDNVEEKVEKIDTNLTDALARVDSLKLDVYSSRVVTLKSLARLEKRPEDDLVGEADNIVTSLMDVQQTKNIHSPDKGKRRN